MAMRAVAVVLLSSKLSYAALVDLYPVQVAGVSSPCLSFVKGFLGKERLSEIFRKCGDDTSAGRCLQDIFEQAIERMQGHDKMEYDRCRERLPGDISDTCIRKALEFTVAPESVDACVTASSDQIAASMCVTRLLMRDLPSNPNDKRLVFGMCTDKDAPKRFLAPAKYPPLPDYLKEKGCEIFWDGQYVRCPNCRYEDNEVRSSRKVTYTGKLQGSGAIHFMKYEGVDVISKQLLPSALASSATAPRTKPDPDFPSWSLSGWRWEGINFGTSKAPIYDSVRFNKKYIKCSHSNRTQSVEMYLRRGKKYEQRAFLPDKERTELQSDLNTNMDRCFMNYIIGKADFDLSQLLKGMAKDGRKKLIQSLMSTLFLSPLVLFPAAGAGAGLVAKAMQECGAVCAHVVDKLREPSTWSDFFGEVIDYGTSEYIQQLGETGKLAEEAMELTDMVLQVKTIADQRLRENMFKLSVTELYAYKALYNPLEDSTSNCSMKAAQKVFKDASDEMDKIRKIESDIKPPGPGTGGGGLGHARGICKKADGWYYAEFGWYICFTRSGDGLKSKCGWCGDDRVQKTNNFKWHDRVADGYEGYLQTKFSKFTFCPSDHECYYDPDASKPR